MRASVAALITCALAGGCGSDTGILIAVKADAETVTVPVEEVEIVVAVREGERGWVKDVSQPELIADVTGRDLTQTPYKALLRDGRPGGEPSTVMVAALGRAGGTEVAFAALDAPQPFMPGKVARHELLMTGAARGDDFQLTPTGCLLWGERQIAAPDDLDCDGEPAPEDCDDEDPNVHTGAEEVCGNGADDNCNGEVDEGCEIECEIAEDCEERFGPPPCGVYECNARQCDVICEDCTDGDLDGFGEGAGCAGPDCDDTDDSLGESGVRRCYDGPDGTKDVGACRAGTQTCEGGVLGACIGQVTPGGEACNGEDDDCDGAIDEDLGSFSCGLGVCATTTAACSGGQLAVCTPGASLASDDETCDGVDDDCDGAIDEDCDTCTKVAPSGDDEAAILDDNATPFATVQAAIDWAAEDPARPQRVCIASGTECGTLELYQGQVVMADGVHVYGRYRSSDFTRCDEATVTALATGSSGGILFPADVQSTTVLDGVQVRRSVAEDVSIGVTIDGASGAVVSNVDIVDLPESDVTYGVRLVGGAEALITGSTIQGGGGIVETAGVVSVESRPTIRDNCASFDEAGRCESECGFDEPREEIRGRVGAGTGQAYGILLVDSPGAAVERNAVCGNAGDAGAAIRIEGAAGGALVRANFISGFGGANESDGVQLGACEGASPWITFNREILASGSVNTSDPVGVRAAGNCHPVIQRNARIGAGSEGAPRATGVSCGADDGGNASRCAILGNGEIRGGLFGIPASATGVRCEDGGCLRIEGNRIDGDRGTATVGLHLVRSGPLVGNNRIGGGCPVASAAGVRAEDAFARLENNRILGGACTGTTYAGLEAAVSAAGSELDVHSNVIGARGSSDVSCTGSAVRLSFHESDGAVTTGLYRNNIFLAGHCSTRRGFVESSGAVAPRLLENNDFAPFEGSQLYLDDGETPLTSPADIDATIAGAAENISVVPGFVDPPTDFHLAEGSACQDAGTKEGAPAFDMDGEARDDTPDIGADER